MRALTAAIAAAGFTAVLVGGVAIATSTSETITACANNRTGAMRYISDGECRSTETTIDWNRQGLQGEQGVPGPAGPAGTSGLEPIGRFTPTQLVAGAVFTCASTSVTETTATCSGMKLNGLDVQGSTGGGDVLQSPAWGEICSVVTGKEWTWPVSHSFAGGIDSEYFGWDGAKWVLYGFPNWELKTATLTCVR
jgi:hypothetical protein